MRDTNHGDGHERFHRPDFGSELPSIAECSWLKDAPPAFRMALSLQLRKVDNLVLGALDFERTHRYLEKYCAYRKEVLTTVGGWSSTTAEAFALSVATEIGAEISSALMLSEVLYNQCISVTSIKTMLTAECGLWRDARAHWLALPSLTSSVGVDRDSALLQGFEEYTRVHHELCNTFHRTEVRANAEIADEPSLVRAYSGGGAGFDLILCWKRGAGSTNYRHFFAQVRQVLSGGGHLVMMVPPEVQKETGRDSLLVALRELGTWNSVGVIVNESNGQGFKKVPVAALCISKSDVVSL